MSDGDNLLKSLLLFCFFFYHKREWENSNSLSDSVSDGDDQTSCKLHPRAQVFCVSNAGLSDVWQLLEDKVL